MADIKISALPSSNPLDGTELVPIVQAGGTYKTTAADIAALAAGGVSSVNGLTGAVVLAVNGSTIGSGQTGVLAYVNASQKLDNLNAFNVNPDYFGFSYNSNYQPNNLGSYESIQNYYIGVDPLQASPDDVVTLFNVDVQIDPNSTGFALGTNGQAANAINLNVNHQGKSNTGQLALSNSSFNLGSGSDAIDIKGLLGYSMFGSVNNQVNFSGGITGFVVSMNLSNGVTFSSSGTYCNIFGDNLQASSTTFYGYASFSASPQLGAIGTNNGASFFNANPQIGSLQGNASATMVYAGGVITGSLGDATGGGYQGVQVNPQLAVIDVNSRGISVGGTATTGTHEWIGLEIFTDGMVTTGNKRGLRINTTDALNSLAIEANGHCNLSSNFNLVSGQGQQYGHVIGGSINMPNGTAITGTDTLANNMAFSVNTGDSGSSWTAASLVGLTTLGFVGQIQGAGTVNGPITFCLNGFADGHTGHIDRVNNFFAAGIPTGAGGTMDDHVLYYGDMPAGAIATNEWGMRIDDSADVGIQNYLPRLALGTSNKKVSSVNSRLDLAEGHLKTTQATPPTANAESAAGTGASASVAGATDVAGFVNLTTGSGAFGTGRVLSVTFNKSYTQFPIVVFTPNNPAAAANPLQISADATLTDFGIIANVAETAPGTSYQWTYHIIEANS